MEVVYRQMHVAGNRPQTNNRNEIYFEVCEVYYDEKDNPYNWAESHNVLVEDTVDELKESYEYISNAFKYPVLKVVGDKLVEEGWRYT
ncbi:MAG: hypothetical protein ABS938_00985 [Psychrobacillus psychrodurans]